MTICDNCIHNEVCGQEGHLEEALTFCINRKTADSFVKQAKWEICSDGYYPYCSECKTEPESGKMTDYCPHCGAYMGTKKIK